MVKPEDGVKCRVWYVSHVSTITDQTVNRIVHVLQAVVQSTTAILIASIGEGSIVGLLDKKLIGQSTEPMKVSTATLNMEIRGTHELALANNCLLTRFG